MPDVVLIRPGCTDYDEQQRVQGSLDLPLNSRGCEQVDRLTDQLAERKLEIIYSSPNEPARSTAELLGQSLGVKIKEKEGFRNLNQGLWEGMKLDEIRRKYPKVLKQWQDSPETICPPEGEAISDALSRLREALQKPLKRKSIFGIVVSEPLASLIGCVVLGSQLEMAPAFCGCDEHPGLEWLKLDAVLPKI
jgi:probable phosphoglycerate mutase